jgi:hypothetical protein
LKEKSMSRGLFIPIVLALLSSIVLGTDALFVFAAYDRWDPENYFSYGDLYWNPNWEDGSSTWSMETVVSSAFSPSGSPYHWNGGLGSALTALGYSWEWYPTFDGRSGQNLPSLATLSSYPVVFVLTFDFYQTEPALNSSSRAVLGDYISQGGHVILVGQDIRYSGVPEWWIDAWFESGSITNDVFSTSSPVPAWGTSGTFLSGWSGTTLMANFTTIIGTFWPDEVSSNGCLEDDNYSFASFSETMGTMFSSYEFETCSPTEVQEIAEMIMIWLLGTPLERTTWGEIKASF